jgi:hypothetical protein
VSSAPFVLAVVLAIAIPVELLRAYRLPDSFVERWARDRGVELTGETRPVVRAYLRRARVMRTWGGVAGAVLPSLLEWVLTGRVQVLGFGTDGESAPLGFGAIFVGYLLGVLAAETTLPRPAGPRRAASLAPRRLEDYLSRRALLAQRTATATAAAVLGILAVDVVPYPPSFNTPGVAGMVAFALGVLAFGAGTEMIERWLVRRPQPFTSPELVAADDAMRAQSIQAFAGAALALLLLLCCGVALGLQASEAGVLQATMIPVAAILLFASLAACRGIGDGAWQVRRAGAVSA